MAYKNRLEVQFHLVKDGYLTELELELIKKQFAAQHHPDYTGNVDSGLGDIYALQRILENIAEIKQTKEATVKYPEAVPILERLARDLDMIEV